MATPKWFLFLALLLSLSSRLGSAGRVLPNEDDKRTNGLDFHWGIDGTGFGSNGFGSNFGVNMPFIGNIPPLSSSGSDSGWGGGSGSGSGGSGGNYGNNGGNSGGNGGGGGGGGGGSSDDPFRGYHEPYPPVPLPPVGAVPGRGGYVIPYPPYTPDPPFYLPRPVPPYYVPPGYGDICRGGVPVNPFQRAYNEIDREPMPPNAKDESTRTTKTRTTDIAPGVQP